MATLTRPWRQAGSGPEVFPQRSVRGWQKAVGMKCLSTRTASSPSEARTWAFPATGPFADNSWIAVRLAKGIFNFFFLRWEMKRRSAVAHCSLLRRRLLLKPVPVRRPLAPGRRQRGRLQTAEKCYGATWRARRVPACLCAPRHAGPGRGGQWGRGAAVPLPQAQRALLASSWRPPRPAYVTIAAIKAAGPRRRPQLWAPAGDTSSSRAAIGGLPGGRDRTGRRDHSSPSQPRAHPRESCPRAWLAAWRSLPKPRAAG